MIVLADLDGTLVDRAGAFTRWARRFVVAHGGDDDDVRWLLDLDADGYAPRSDVTAALQHRLGLQDGVPRLVERLLFEHVDDVRPFPGVREELHALRTGSGGRAPAVVVVVTNGTVAQQERKLAVSGLVDDVDGVVVSEAVGVKKPDRRVFEVAVARAAQLGGAGAAWMVGDHAVADVAGGSGAGLLTGWVSGGRPWPGGPRPDLVAVGTAELLAAVRRGAALKRR